MKHAMLVNSSGGTATLGSLAAVEELPGQTEVRRENLQREVEVTARLEGVDLGTGIAAVQKAVADLKLPPSIRVEYGGTYQEQQKSFRDLAMVLVLAVVLVFLVLLFEFRSFTAPVAILSSAILSTSGVFLALLVTRTTFNVSSFMGLIMVIGIVAKNGILLLDANEKFRAAGFSAEEAIIQAGRRRLRPIVMTALAAVAGMLPLALALGAGSQMLQPLAIAVIGGHPDLDGAVADHHAGDPVLPDQVVDRPLKNQPGSGGRTVHTSRKPRDRSRVGIVRLLVLDRKRLDHRAGWRWLGRARSRESRAYALASLAVLPSLAGLLSLPSAASLVFLLARLRAARAGAGSLVACKRDETGRKDPATVLVEVDHRMLVVDFDQRAQPVGRLHDAVTFGPRFHGSPAPLEAGDSRFIPGLQCPVSDSERLPARLAPSAATAAATVAAVAAPPPPPPENSGFGRASLTVNARPPIWNWLNSEAAFCASSSVDISTNAKPRARPVAASRMTRTDSTVPALLNSSCSSASPAE